MCSAISDKPLVPASVVSTPLKTSPTANQAATAIQRVFRGHRARIEASRLGLLNHALYQKAKLASCDFSRKLDVPGESTVLRVPDLPQVIIKLCSGLSAKERLQKMRAFRDICKTNSFRNLIIPQVRIDRTRLIEERLPIATKDLKKDQIRIYLAHPKEFTEAIQEFTVLNCMYDCQDIADEDFFHSWGHPMGRYDNFPLVILEENGTKKYAIGLIDLEHCNPLPNIAKTGEEVADRIKKVILLFPLHFDAIMAIGERFSEDVSEHRQKLMKARDEALSALKVFHTPLDIGHQRFLETQEVTLAQPTKLPEGLTKMSPARKSEICDKYINRLNRLRRVVPPLYLEAINADGFKELFPKFIDLIIQLLDRSLKNRIDEVGSEASIKSYPSFIAARQMRVNVGDEHQLMIDINSLLTKVADKDLFMNFTHATDIYESILRELEAGKEIYKEEGSIIL